MGLFGGDSTTVQQTTQQTYDQQFQTGDNSIGLAAGASFNEELPDNAVTLLSNFAEALVDVTKSSLGNSAAQNQQTITAVETAKSSSAALDLKTLAPYLLAGGALIAIVFIFRK